MTADSRMIYLNTAVPQYKVEQVKTKLFLSADNQNTRICEWWLRLYHGEYFRRDLEILIELTEGKKMEEIWDVETDGLDWD